MTRKNFSLILVLAAIVMIPQLLFWWLTPVTAAARLAVYIGGTILTVGIPLAYLVTYWKSNLRKTAGLSVVCCVLEIAVVVLSALLLRIDVSIRSAVFTFIITTLVIVIILIPLINASLKLQRQGVYSAEISSDSVSQLRRDSQIRNDQIGSTQSHNPIPSHMPHQIPTRKPLPPRNR
jgi:hypothetical protein